jgi:D-alanine--D-alanine ligase
MNSGVHNIRIGLIFGGPSKERGISLNSARTVMDHLKPFNYDFFLYYCDPTNKFHCLLPEHLYSNTPEDFYFELKKTAEPFETGLIKACKNDLIDIVFPVIHGEFGEDGVLQELLEKNKIPFVGSSSRSCRRMFDKVRANKVMEKNDFTTLPNYYFNNPKEVILDKVENFFEYLKDSDFFEDHHDTKVVVKPSAGGSSIGVKTATTAEMAVKYAKEIFTKNYGGKAMIEPYCKGREFTVIVLESKKDKPVALIPTEIRLFGGDIFTYRTKYLPSLNVEYHCPPRFNDMVIRQIQKSAKKLFILFKMRDFARMDGWLLKDGSLVFSDFNPISGMEQNSAMFVQGSRLGFTHSDILRYIVTHAIRREYKSKIEKLNAEKLKVDQSDIDKSEIKYDFSPVTKIDRPKKVRVLFGGETSERQISVMSGTNVWLKLLSDEKYDPRPYILTSENRVWELKYCFMLNYTCEELLANCRKRENITQKLKVHAPKIMHDLDVAPFIGNIDSPRDDISLNEFCEEAKEGKEFVFIALHGGEGEDGRVQAKLEEHNLAYNGSDEGPSKLCMDKYLTGKVIFDLKDPLLISATKLLIPAKPTENAEEIWDDAVKLLKTSNILIKPQADGSSTGVKKLETSEDLRKYLKAIEQGQKVLLQEKRSGGYSTIELPNLGEQLNFILEQYYGVDKYEVNYNAEPYALELKSEEDSKINWIEMTIGVLQDGEACRALTPSITVAQENVLSMVEKFESGTGLNITPPPKSIITEEQIKEIKGKIELVAKVLGIQGYARIDILFNKINNIIIVIEANSLPALTPSSVIFKQAYLSDPALNPQKFLAKIINLGIQRWKKKQRYPKAKSPSDELN